MPSLSIKQFAATRPERELPPRCAHLWQARVSQTSEAVSAITLADIAEAGSLAVARERSVFLHLRSLTRKLGARYLGGPATELACGRDADGAWVRRGDRRLRYSAESAGDDLACVFSLRAPVRLSLENIDETLALDDLATSCLPPEDAWRILIARGAERAKIFYRLWTRTEVNSRLPGRKIESFSPHSSTVGAVELPGPDWTLVPHLEPAECPLAA